MPNFSQLSGIDVLVQCHNVGVVDDFLSMIFGKKSYKKQGIRMKNKNYQDSILKYQLKLVPLQPLNNK